MKRSILLLLLACILLPTTTFAWETVPGPSPHYMSLLTDTEGYRMVTALRNGGVWRSDDWGASWTPINQTIMSGSQSHLYQSLGMTAVDADLDSILVRALYQPSTGYEFCATSFFGFEWHPLLPEDQDAVIRKVIADWSDGDHLLGLNQGTLYDSWNYGHSWTERSFVTTPLMTFDFVQDPLDEQSFYLTIMAGDPYDTSVLFKSADRCTTWTPLMRVDSLISWNYSTLNGPFFLRSGNILLTSSAGFNDLFFEEVGTERYLFRSEDGGISWTIGSGGIPNDMLGSQIIQDPLSNRIYMWNSPSGWLYESLDDAYSFQRVTNGLPHDLRLIQQIEVNSRTGAVYLLSPSHGIYVTTDGGDTWEDFGSVIPLGRSMNLRVEEDCILAQGKYDDASYIYHIASDEWEPLQPRPATGDTIRSLLPILLEDENRTISFEVVRLAGQDDFSMMQPLVATTESPDPQPLYTPAVTDDESAFDFHRLSIYQDDSHFRMAYCAPEENDTYTIHVSADTGRTWISSPDWPAYPTIKQGQEVLYAIMREDGIFRSTNYGLDWEDLVFPEDIPLPGTIHAEINPFNGGFFLFADNQLMHFLNGTWTQRSGYTGSTACATLIPGNPPRLVRFVNRDSNIPYLAVTANGGGSWSTFATEEMTPLFGEQYTAYHDVVYDPWRDQLWVSTPIGLMHTESFRVVDVAEEERTGQPTTHLLLDAYPNPFNGTTHIQFSLPESGEVELAVYDLQGRLVTKLLDDLLQAGEHSSTIHASEWPSGTYFLSLKTPAGEVTKKITLVK